MEQPQPLSSLSGAHLRTSPMELQQALRRASPMEMPQSLSSLPGAHQRASPMDPQQPQRAPQLAPPQLGRLQWGAPREEKPQPSRRPSSGEPQQLPYLGRFAVTGDAEQARLVMPPPELARAMGVDRGVAMMDQEMWRRLLKPCKGCGQVPMRCFCDNLPMDLSASRVKMAGDINKC